jgi:acyl carrier protein
MSQDTEQRIGAIIARHRAPDAPPMTADFTLKDAGVDSLNAIEILFDVEEEFKVNLPDRDPQFDTATFQGLVDAVDAALLAKSADVPDVAPG